MQLLILTVESLLSTKLFLPWYKDIDARVIVTVDPRSFVENLLTSVFHTVTPDRQVRQKLCIDSYLVPY